MTIARTPSRSVPECLALVGPSVSWPTGDPAPSVAAARHATWQGRANVLSSRSRRVADHRGGHARRRSIPVNSQLQLPTPNFQLPTPEDLGVGPFGSWEFSRSSSSSEEAPWRSMRGPCCRASASSRCCRSCDPAAPPFDALDWPPHVHLALFVHRVEGLVPGVYAYLRDARSSTNGDRRCDRSSSGSRSPTACSCCSRPT